MFIPRTGFSQLKPIELSEKVANVQLKIASMTEFATVVPAVAAMNTLLDNYNTAISSAYQGTPADREHRNSLTEKVIGEFTMQIVSIAALCHGNLELFLATGLEVRRERTTVTSLAVPKDVIFLNPTGGGELVLKFRGVRHALGYDVYFGTDVSNLQFYGHFSRNRIFINGLVPGTQYFAKVLAVGSRNLSSPLSNAAAMRVI